MLSCSSYFLNEHSEPTPKTSQPLIPPSDTPGTPDTCTGSPVTRIRMNWNCCLHGILWGSRRCCLRALEAIVLYTVFAAVTDCGPGLCTLQIEHWHLRRLWGQIWRPPQSLQFITRRPRAQKSCSATLSFIGGKSPTTSQGHFRFTQLSATTPVTRLWHQDM